MRNFALAVLKGLPFSVAGALLYLALIAAGGNEYLAEVAAIVIAGGLGTMIITRKGKRHA